MQPLAVMAGAEGAITAASIILGRVSLTRSLYPPPPAYAAVWSNHATVFAFEQTRVPFTQCPWPLAEHAQLRREAGISSIAMVPRCVSCAGAP